MLTDKEAKHIYNSARWKEKRMQILIRDHFECQDCRARLENAVSHDIQLKGWERKIHRATQVHHIIELKERPDLAFDDDNLVSLCGMCHNIRHGRGPFQFENTPSARRQMFPEKW